MVSKVLGNFFFLVNQEKKQPQKKLRENLTPTNTTNDKWKKKGKALKDTQRKRENTGWRTVEKTDVEIFKEKIFFWFGFGLLGLPYFNSFIQFKSQNIDLSDRFSLCGMDFLFIHRFDKIKICNTSNRQRHQRTTTTK